MQELISIIVPIYNVEEFLPRCIDSLLAQTYSNIEIILVDDCSTDRSAEIAQNYSRTYPTKCKYIQREKNGGLSAARNSGMRCAKGTWFAFIDSDDWITEDYIQSMYLVAQSDCADVVMCERWHQFSDGRNVKVNTLNGLSTNSTKKEIIALCLPSAPTRLIKGSLFIDNNIWFPEDIRRAEDTATIIPLLTRAKKISVVPRAMYCYFQRGTSLSNGNYKGADVSFYPKTINRMMELSLAGYETELEYRAITELLYGMVMIMIRAGYTEKEIKTHIDDFITKFPNWKRNCYLKHMVRGKRIFVWFAARKHCEILKLLIMLWDIRVKLKR